MSDQGLPPGAVVAVGTAVNTQVEGLGRVMEQAAVAAILDCYARGQTDPETILAAKRAAMDKAKADFEARAG